MSGTEKSVFLKKLIKEAVIEALQDKDLLGKIMQGVVDYTIEQQTGIMEALKKNTVNELAGRTKLVESNRQRVNPNPNNGNNNGSNRQGNPKIAKVENITKTLFNGKNVFSDITQEQLNSVPRPGQNIESGNQLNISGLKGMFQDVNFKDGVEDDPRMLQEEFTPNQIRQQNFTPRQPKPQPVVQQPVQQQSSEPKKPRFSRPPEQVFQAPPPQRQVRQMQPPRQQQRSQNNLMQDRDFNPNEFARPQVEAGLFDPSEITGGMGFIQPDMMQEFRPFLQNQEQYTTGTDYGGDGPFYEDSGADDYVNSLIQPIQYDDGSEEQQ
jgi:hypothetical protein